MDYNEQKSWRFCSPYQSKHQIHWLLQVVKMLCTTWNKKEVPNSARLTKFDQQISNHLLTMRSYHLFHLSSVKHLFRLEQCDKITRSFPEYLAQHYKTAENKFFGKVCSKFCQKLNTASNILPKTFTFLPKTFTFLPKWRYFCPSGDISPILVTLDFSAKL